MVAQEMLSLKIIETQKDGEVSISFDDGEFENDLVDKMDDDDLDMGWEGEDLNIMTTFTRFQNVTIPQGAIIDSAFLNIYAHEDEADEAKVNIYAEASDNSAIFTEAELITSRTWTTAKIDWDITAPWTMWKPYRSPDVKSLVQEVINREGWASGNSLTLFFKGEDQGASLLDNARDFESYENIEDPEDGGDGLHHPERVPTLTIYFHLPNAVTITIIETQKDGDVSISFDDGEFENDAVDKMDDDDLDMGWEGEDLNIMTTFTRFQKVAVPQGAKIDSAFLHIYAHEDEADEARVNIFAEAADNSAIFTEAELITSRTWTTAKIDWDITAPWTMWKPYRSPDLKSLVQEVINREGWVSGNSLTLFFQGEDQGASLLDNARDFESYENIEDPEDGGDGLHHPERVPTLKIYYSLSTSVSQAKNAHSFTIYPNPSANGMFTIDMKDEVAAIGIYSINGALVKSVKPTGARTSVDASGLAKGIYMVKATSSDRVVVEKLIIK